MAKQTNTTPENNTVAGTITSGTTSGAGGIVGVNNLQITSGTFGNNGKWTLDNGVLTLEGTGAMKNFESSSIDKNNVAPWSSVRLEISKVIIKGFTTIGSHAFVSCTNLLEVSLPSSITSIGNYAFYCCSKLLGIALPSGIISIGDFAFGLTPLQAITIPNTVQTIGVGAFYFAQIQVLNIPVSVTTIGANHSQYLTEFKVDSENKNFSSVNGVLFNKNMTTLIACPAAKSDDVYNIPDTVKVIAEYAFDSSKLSKITIPNSVSSIEKNAFDSIKANDIHIGWTNPDNVKLGDNIFFRADHIKLHIPHGTKDLYKEADVWKNLKNIIEDSPVIQPTTGSTSGGGIVGANNLQVTSGTFGTNGKWNLKDGILTVEGSGKMGDFTHQNSSENQNNIAPWSNVQSPVFKIIVKGFTTIGRAAFASIAFREVSEIIIPLGIISIGDSAFHNCISVKSITLPNTVQTIGESVFFSFKITTLEIPASVMTIGNYFPYTLAEFKVDPKNNYFTAIDGVLFNKSKTRLVAYPASSVRTNNTYIIPSSVNEIAEYAFASNKLSKITIPSSVTMIGVSCFSGSFLLSEVTVKWKDLSVVRLKGDVFPFIDTQKITLHVPPKTADVYAEAPVWKDFEIDGDTALSKISTKIVDEDDVVNSLFNLALDRIRGIKPYLQSFYDSKIKIYDIPTLLTRGRTKADRDKLALDLYLRQVTASATLNEPVTADMIDGEVDKIYDSFSDNIRNVKLSFEKIKETIEIGLLTSWIKQGDLLRLPGMTPDAAYMLVSVGIRNAVDLRKMDIEKATPILRIFEINHPDFDIYPESPDLKTYIEDLVNIAGEFSTLYSFVEITDDEEPVPNYLLIDPTETVMTTPEENFEKIAAGVAVLAGLSEIPVLPLPTTISGVIQMKSEGDYRGIADVYVSLDGILSPNMDILEDKKDPFAFTNNYGEFTIRMPEKYNLKENINIIVRQGEECQTFVKSAAEVINVILEAKLEKLKKQLDNEDLGDEDLKDEALTKMALEELSKLPILDSHVGSFVLTADGFKYTNKTRQPALPSVNLMGEGSDAIKLATDTAPARIFQYNMLQRIVEPTIYPNAPDMDGKADNGRAALKSPIKVSDFKEKLYTDPDKIPKMASLGMGYVMKMHQAWVPDGFSLGNLLYSLILAPGEEQRIVVRERSESYTVMDNMSGMDTVTEDYDLQQKDSANAAYNYAMNQMSHGDSGYKAKSTTTSFGLSGGGGGGGFSLGGSFGRSSTNSSGSAYANQNNSHSDASSSAQAFQHSIKSSSEKVALANRMSVRMATSSESDSVASKVIANHNHSHAMTIQYWEVMRRYRLETCIDGIELVLFIPLEIIRFIPEKTVLYNNVTTFAGIFKDNPSETLITRYKELLKYHDVLESSLPYKYKTGLNILQKFASYPNWELEKVGSEVDVKTLTLEIEGNFMFFDDLSARLILKNGSSIAGSIVSYDRDPVQVFKKYIYSTYEEMDGPNITELYNRKDVTEYKYINYESTEELYAAIKERRNKNLGKKFICTFDVPSTIIDDDYSRIEVSHSYEDVTYMLTENLASLTGSQNLAYNNYQDKMWDFSKDDKSSGKDLRRMDHYDTFFPEAFLKPKVTILANKLRSFGAPIIYRVSLIDGVSTEFSDSDSIDKVEDELSIIASSGTIRQKDIRRIIENIQSNINTIKNKATATIPTPTATAKTTPVTPATPVAPTTPVTKLITTLSSSNLDSKVSIGIVDKTPTMRFTDLQKIEITLKHVCENALHYSQLVWSSLTRYEREILLEPYTAWMPVKPEHISSMSEEGEPAVEPKMDSISVPLLNCVNNEVLGYYGNCILMPFTYPERMADAFGKTAKELQDWLYNYHTNSFRVPTTTISLPTEGMIGEAVLGATNVSEVIDLTRFWNWKDSDIDHAEKITPDYFKQTGLLATAQAPTLTMPTQGAAAPTAVTVPDLLTAMVNKQTPTFDNITGLDQLKSIMENMNNTNAAAATTALTARLETDAKAKAEQEAKDKAEKEAKDKAEKEAQEKAKKAAEEAAKKAGEDKKKGQETAEDEDDKTKKSEEEVAAAAAEEDKKKGQEVAAAAADDKTKKSEEEVAAAATAEKKKEEEEKKKNEQETAAAEEERKKKEQEAADVNNNKSFNYKVDGIFPDLSQVMQMGCWATTSAAMLSWKSQASIPIEVIVSEAENAPGGESYLDKYEKDSGLQKTEWTDYCKKLGLTNKNAEFDSPDELLELLKKHGPLIIVIDENSTKTRPVDARVLYGMKDNSKSNDNPILLFMDPSSGTSVEKAFSESFKSVYEDGAWKQVVYFK